LPWRAFFADEGLQRVIETALDHNRDLRLALLSVERARAAYGIRKAERYPVVNGGAGYSAQRVPADLTSEGQAATREQYDVSLVVPSWEMDFFGRIGSLQESALEAYLATEQGLRSAQILVVSEIAKAYLALAADRENLQLAQTTFATQQEAYRLIRRRYEVGIAAELDLRQAQTQVDIARRDIARFTQQVAQDRNALDLLSGNPVPAHLLPENLEGILSPNGIPVGTSSSVLLQRPDVRAAEHRLKGANADIGAARAALFPRIALTASAGTASDELLGLFASGSGAWTFVPRMTFPIFDGRLRSALAATRTEREISRVQYEKTIQTAFREVADALAARGMLEEQISAQQSLVDAAAETFRISEARYGKGLDSYLSVLVAQRSLYAARQVLVFLSLQERVNQVQLYAVLGGGAE
jgi:multidrug efflux system outer membrane protein